MPLEKEPDLPDLAPAGLALLIVFGLLMWYDRPIESSRPFDLYAQHQYRAIGYAFENWLWQDPFDPIDNPFPFDPIFQKKKEGQCENQLKERVKKKLSKNIGAVVKSSPQYDGK